MTGPSAAGRPGKHEYVFQRRGGGASVRFRYDPVSDRLYRDGDAVPLQPRAAALLGYLLAEHGRVVSRNELMEEVWEGMIVADSSVTEAVALVRSALDDDPGEPAFIQTVPRRGYRFIAPVEVVPWQPDRPRAAGGSGAVRQLVPCLLVVLVAGLLGWWLGGRAAAPAEPALPVRARLALPAPPRIDADAGPGLALSPDGSLLVYVAAHGEGSRLQVVDLREGARWPLERSLGRPRAPFLSPDGGGLAYFQRGELMVVSVAGGREAMPAAVAAVPRARLAAGCWLDDDRIVYSPGIGHGLWLLEIGSGSEPEPLTELAPGEGGHVTPDSLGGTRVLFGVLDEVGGTDPAVALETVDLSGERRAVEGGGGGLSSRFVPPSTVVISRSSSLFAARFDPDGPRLEEPRPIPVPARGRPGGAAQFAAGREGTLVILPAPRNDAAALHWVDFRGTVDRIDRSVGQPLDSFRISPDARRLVGERRGDLWTLELFDAAFRRLTSSPALETRPVWGPGADRITFATDRDGEGFDVHTMELRMPGRSDRLVGGPGDEVPDHWSATGERLLFTRRHPATGEDVWIREASGEIRPLVATEARERDGRFTPDGRWVAVVSDRSGVDEIWLLAPDGSGEGLRMTQGGGAMPRWRSDGSALFFRRGPELYRLGVRLEPTYHPDTERRLFRERAPGFRYDLAPGGLRALVQRLDPDPWWREAILLQDGLAVSEPTP